MGPFYICFVIQLFCSETMLETDAGSVVWSLTSLRATKVLVEVSVGVQLRASTIACPQATLRLHVHVRSELMVVRGSHLHAVLPFNSLQ